MNKSLSILSLLIFWLITLTWCDKPTIETAEQECTKNNWEVTTDELWNNICLFNAHERCQISQIESWTCDYLNNEFDDSDYPEYWAYSEYPDPVKICEYNGWKIINDEEEWPMCYFLEAEWCTLDSIDRGDCAFLSDEYNYQESWETSYPSWEQICMDHDGQISETENGSGICIFNDEDMCYLEDLEEWWCDLLPPKKACPKDWMPVCWKDWNTYSNRCLLEAAWVEEETQAEITEDWCVFG